jgi:hypothetical protein
MLRFAVACVTAGLVIPAGAAHAAHAAGIPGTFAVSAKKKKKAPAAKCPAGTTPVVVKRGHKPVVKRDKRGRLRCRALKRSAVPAPAQTPMRQVGQVADVLESAADINPKAFKKLNRLIGSRRSDRLLNLGLVAWRETAGAARAHASESETKSFSYGGADGKTSFSLERIQGAQSGFAAAASAEMKISRADLEKLSTTLKDNLPADVTGATAKVAVSFEDVATTCPDDKGAVPGKLRGKGSLSVTVERSGGAPPIEVKISADVNATYTAHVGADGKVDAINGLDVQTTFQAGDSRSSTETYRGRIVGSGFGRQGLLDAPSGTTDAAIQRDWSHVDPNSGGVFGPHGSWRYGRGFPISDLRTVDNLKAMVATNIATTISTLAALEYLRKVTLDRIDTSACAYQVLVDMTSLFKSATHDASGQLKLSVDVRAVPGSADHWTGSAPAQYADVVFTPHIECPYVAIVNTPGTFKVDIKRLASGNLEVSWTADPTTSASVDCPPTGEPPYDPPPQPGQPGPSTVGATPTTFELPASGGSQAIGGGIDGGGGDGYFDSGTLVVSPSR